VIQNSKTLSEIDRAVELIRTHPHSLAFTGAGFSVPSGIPDFRSAGTGLWRKFDPMEVASLSAFHHNPAAFFNWLQPLAEKITHLEPNKAHIALTNLQAEGYFDSIITQNIDGFHQRAGSKNVIELHGSLSELHCLNCNINYLLEDFSQSWIIGKKFPACPDCQAYLKPSIVLYEEMLPPDAWGRAEYLCETTDLLLIAGTSLEVMPAGGLPFRCLHNKAKLVILNLSPTPIDAMADVVIHMDVAETLPEIYARLAG
jgi:NAD-dependent deacetylase